jgi:hypothetical protein
MAYAAVVVPYMAVQSPHANTLFYNVEQGVS